MFCCCHGNHYSYHAACSYEQVPQHWSSSKCSPVVDPALRRRTAAIMPLLCTPPHMHTTHISTHTPHTSTHSHLYTCTPLHTHTSTHSTHAHFHTLHTCTPLHGHTSTHAHLHMHTSTHAHLHIHTSTHAHLHMHTSTHAHLAHTHTSTSDLREDSDDSRGGQHCQE